MKRWYLYILSLLIDVLRLTAFCLQVETRKLRSFNTLCKSIICWVLKVVFYGCKNVVDSLTIKIERIRGVNMPCERHLILVFRIVTADITETIRLSKEVFFIIEARYIDEPNFTRINWRSIWSHFIQFFVQINRLIMVSFDPLDLFHALLE